MASSATLPCGEPGVLVCDDFEGPLTQYARMGNVAPTTERSYRGQRSVKATTAQVGGRAQLIADFTPQVEGTTLYARAYYYIPEHASLHNITLLDLPQCAAVVTSGGFALWCRENRFFEGQVEVPRDRWFCLNWIHQVGTDVTTDLFIDGELVATLTGANTEPENGVVRASFPAAFSLPPQPPVELFVDNFVISTFELGCD